MSKLHVVKSTDLAGHSIDNANNMHQIENRLMPPVIPVSFLTFCMFYETYKTTLKNLWAINYYTKAKNKFKSAVHKFAEFI